jgi:hypothetical protein
VTGTIEPYCSGQNCPLKYSCLRFKSDIVYGKEAHLAFPPYDATKKKCGFLLSNDGSNILNQIEGIIKNKKGGGHD